MNRYRCNIYIFHNCKKYWDSHLDLVNTSPLLISLSSVCLRSVLPLSVAPIFNLQSSSLPDSIRKWGQFDLLITQLCPLKFQLCCWRLSILLSTSKSPRPLSSFVSSLQERPDYGTCFTQVSFSPLIYNPINLT